MQAKHLLSVAVLFLPWSIGATPVSATVSEQALALGAALEGWTQAHGLENWKLTLDSNRTTEVSQWPLTLTFGVGSEVTKDQVDRAELEFYPWFRKTAPGLVPEATFLRQEVWQATLAAPGTSINSDAFESADLGEGLSRASVTRHYGSDGNILRVLDVTWTWPADLTPSQERDEALARQKRQNQVAATWTKLVSTNAPGSGSKAWAERAGGGADLAAALETAYREAAKLSRPTKFLPTYSLVMAREGARGRWDDRGNPWYPDQVYQALGIAIDGLAPQGPIPWDQWSAVRHLWGSSPLDVNYRFFLEFDTSQVTDLETWRQEGQAELTSITSRHPGGWSWGGPEAQTSKVQVEVSVAEYDPQLLAEVSELHKRFSRP